MANIYTKQVLKDTNQFAVIKLTGVFDGSGDENNVSRIQANTLLFALDSSGANLLSSVANTGPQPFYGLSVSKIWYNSSFQSPAHAELFWTATTNDNFLSVEGNGTYNDNGNWITIPNPTKGAAGSNGDIGIRTFGAVANTSYNIIIELRKDNSNYDRGAHSDPAAFNYNQYGVTP